MTEFQRAANITYGF